MASSHLRGQKPVAAHPMRLDASTAPVGHEMSGGFLERHMSVVDIGSPKKLGSGVHERVQEK